MRDFLPGTATPFEGRPSAATKQKRLVNNSANRALTNIQRGTNGPMAGQQVTPTDKRNQAALMALTAKVREANSAKLAGGGDAARAGSLAAQADLEEEQQRQALAQAASNIKAGALRKVGTLEPSNPYGDLDVTTALDMHGASALANNTALGKATPQTQIPYGARGTEMSGQGARQLQSTIAQQQQQQARAVEQQMAAANEEARRVRERSRIATEGDAWLASMQQPQQGGAVTALARR